jgi:2-hydroxychromene-2-carboxylate isomerase
MAGQSTPERPVFYFDLGSPYAYLAAERVSGLFTEAGLKQPEWAPILLGGLFRRFGRDSWANGAGRAEGMAEVERRASAYGLPPIRWPSPWPGNTLLAMRAATFAKQTGRTVSFALAGFRQAFAAGHDLSEPDGVVIAAAACELHPRAVLKAAGTTAVKDGLRAATEAAGDRGVRGVPSLLVGNRVFWGDDRLEQGTEAAALAA